MIPNSRNCRGTVLQFDSQPCGPTAEAVPANPGGTTFVADVVADGVLVGEKDDFVSWDDYSEYSYVGDSFKKSSFVGW